MFKLVFNIAEKGLATQAQHLSRMLGRGRAILAHYRTSVSHLPVGQLLLPGKVLRINMRTGCVWHWCPASGWSHDYNTVQADPGSVQENTQSKSPPTTFNTLSNVDFMLGQRRSRWPNIKSTLARHLVSTARPPDSHISAKFVYRTVKTECLARNVI